MKADGISVAYRPDERRFVATVPGHDEVAFLSVVPATTTWSFVHTEAPPSLRGTGVASELVRAAIAHVRALGLSIRPTCPFVLAYLKRHPEDADVVHPRYRSALSREGDEG